MLVGITYFLLITAIVGVIIFLIYNYKHISERKIKEELSENWNKSKQEDFDFEKISLYYDLNIERNNYELSSQTKKDIDFEELFKYIDRTKSKVGQQFLYNRLSSPITNTKDLLEMNERVSFFKANLKLCFDIQHLLHSLNKKNAYTIANLLSQNKNEKVKWIKLLYIYVVLLVILLCCIPFFKAIAVWIMLPLSINVMFNLRNKMKLYYYIDQFPQLNQLINVSQSLTKLDLPYQSEEVKNSIKNLKAFQRKFRQLFISGNVYTDEIIRSILFLIELFRAMFLIDIFTFFSLMKIINDKQEEIITLFKYVGLIDMELSVASLRSGDEKLCIPDFINNEKALEIRGLRHPLISDCVLNDITLQDKSVLITGSNMSGKTTFLRAVAINILLAETIYTCFANKVVIPFSHIGSSIKIGDNILEGKSYYFQEVEIMGGLIENSEKKFQNMFFLDEVFKGTNTIERIASAKTILEYLNKGNNIVFVSTHDIELSEMLKSEFDLYHFEETIIDNKLHFDHKLKVGELKTRNAIKILELAGYPKNITENAKILSDELSLQFMKSKA